MGPDVWRNCHDSRSGYIRHESCTRRRGLQSNRLGPLHNTRSTVPDERRRSSRLGLREFQAQPRAWRRLRQSYRGEQPSPRYGGSAFSKASAELLRCFQSVKAVVTD